MDECGTPYLICGMSLALALLFIAIVLLIGFYYLYGGFW